MPFLTAEEKRTLDRPARKELRKQRRMEARAAGKLPRQVLARRIVDSINMAELRELVFEIGLAVLKNRGNMREAEVTSILLDTLPEVVDFSELGIGEDVLDVVLSVDGLHIVDTALSEIGKSSPQKTNW